ncbi:MAG: UPF0280 family protein [Deferrisomatales bacterium]|nr:UPF0280 family protein [Deferrisomatales bacterium]
MHADPGTGPAGGPIGHGSPGRGTCSLVDPPATPVGPGAGERTYRSFARTAGPRTAFRVRVETTDLYLRADRDLSPEALEAARRARREVEAHIADRPAFATALTPLSEPGGVLPPVIASMYAAGQAAGVGPMAAVAGALAGAVGRELRRWSLEVLVENGGDVFLDLADETIVGLFAGGSPFSGRIGLRVAPGSAPLGVCTSSGTVGPSLSYGRADAATAVAADPALADAVATAVANRVREPGNLAAAVEWALTVPGVRGAFAVLGDRLAAVGEVELVALRS